MNGIKGDPRRIGVMGPVPPSREGKIIPAVGGVQRPPSPTKGAGIPDWEISKKPDSMNPDKVLSIESIPELFKTIERIMGELMTLNAEFCLKGEKFPEVWLVPVYTSAKNSTRREISFGDAAKLVVLTAAFNGEITEMKFLD